ncbi:short-chain dehydrogenase [Candidatus Hepatincola sp. Pdp]
MRLVLITGGTSGIGFALVEQYLNHGYRVIFTGRNKQKVAETVQYFSQYPNFILGQVVDVRNAVAMNTFIQYVAQNYGLDIVIANAGIASNFIKQVSLAEMANTIFSTNVNGVFNTMHPSIEVMMRKGEGQIAIVSSLASYFGLKTSPYYASSKAAIRVLAEGISPLLKQHNIILSTIIPGFIESKMVKQSAIKKLPMLMSAATASKIIFQGIKKRKRTIIFPKPMFALIYVLSLLPLSVRELIMNKMLVFSKKQ